MTYGTPEMNATGADKRVKGTGTLFESSSISILSFYSCIFMCVCLLNMYMIFPCFFSPL